MLMLFSESLSPAVDEVRLEVYRLPKEAWLRELQPLQQMLEQSASPDNEEEPSSVRASVFVLMCCTSSIIWLYVYGVL